MTDPDSQLPLDLPSPPATLAAVISAASDPAVTKTELGALVAKDPAFSLRILAVVNSSVYRRGQKIASADRAVSVLGSRTLRNIALCAATQNCMHASQMGDFDLGLFWEASLRRAVGAQLVTEAVGEGAGVEPMQAFTAGLLQDLGVLALVKREPNKAAQWMAYAQAPWAQRRRVERELFGQSHDELSRSLVKLWQLPEELAKPMLLHHDPESAEDPWKMRVRLSACGEEVADFLAAPESAAALKQVCQKLEALVGLETPQVHEILTRAGDRVLDAASAFKIRVGAQPSPKDLIEEASKGLMGMSMSYEEMVQSLERTLEEREVLARELSLRNDMLERMAVTDTLTSLPNRRAFNHRMDADIDSAALKGMLMLMLVDVDHFKSINDTFGHDVGDVVLRKIAGSLANAADPEMLVARVGGEEFGVLGMAKNDDHMRQVAQALCDAVRSIAWPAQNFPQQVTISLGMAFLKGPSNSKILDEADIARRLYRAADRALYHAKQSGRDRWIKNKKSIAWALVDPEAKGLMNAA